MALFEIPKKSKEEKKKQNKKIINKARQEKKKVDPKVKQVSTFLDKIQEIEKTVEEKIGKLKDEYIIITDKEQLQEYINAANSNDVISIDTETTGLNPIMDTLVGICLYTPGKKSAYVPVNHVSYPEEKRLEGQISEQELKPIFDSITAKIIMFNATFDIRVIRNQIGSYLTCYWDCYIAARLMNENEQQKNGLKSLHEKYVLKGEDKEFTFSDLFKGITFDKVPINSAYIYAAHDAIITYELYEFQKKYLRPDGKNGMDAVYKLFMEIEMPCSQVVCDMEDTGIKIDLEYTKNLSEKYHLLEEEALNKCNSEIEKLKDKIEDWRKTPEANKKTQKKNKDGSIKVDGKGNIEYNKSKSEQLPEKIAFSSPTQLAILFYDVMGLKPLDKSTPRGTGEDILKKMDTPLSNAILEYRGIVKLLSTYIDKMPEVILPDGKVHCRFNQVQAVTGRFSSSDPNLQNIPAKNKEIRKMFVADEGHILMSSDYSQQEVKVMAEMCGDKKMKQAFIEGKDFYGEIAAVSFNREYKDCLEFYLDENGNKTTEVNKEGKKYRTQAKSILLGILYGRGESSIAEQLGCTTQEARNIKQTVFKGFPAIEQFEKDSVGMAKEKGYVTTLWGRKRRLPDIRLPKYEFKWEDENKSEKIPDYISLKYLDKLESAKYWKDKDKIIKQAREIDKVIIVQNGGKISDAQRQAVNSRIQGSAADMTKKALVAINNNARLKELGCQLLIPVHDEIIIQCPIENAKEVKYLFAKTMEDCAKDKLHIPISCDVECSYAWYGESIDI